MSQEMPRGLKRWEVVRKRGQGEIHPAEWAVGVCTPGVHHFDFCAHSRVLCDNPRSDSPSGVQLGACRSSFRLGTLDGDGEMVSEVHREERWSTRDVTMRWSEPLTGKKITKVKLESRTLKSELTAVSGRSSCSR